MSSPFASNAFFPGQEAFNDCFFGDEWHVLGDHVLAAQQYGAPWEVANGGEDLQGAGSPAGSSTEEVSWEVLGGEVHLEALVGEEGVEALGARFWPRKMGYAPLQPVLAQEPEEEPDRKAIYEPLTTSHFKTAAEAKEHRRRARLSPKSKATDVARVKQFGREYWVRRIFNAMIDTRNITDGEKSIHRLRFTQKLSGEPAFSALDLEATAHHVFDKAIAVHERGWNRPTVYHKDVVRGKLRDVSETSVERRLSRICLCLQQKKSSVDDAMRGGVTLALLCDNPEARRCTKESNDVGNKKRGERLRVTSKKEKTKGAQALQQQNVEDKGEAEEDFEEFLDFLE
ncbi:hypothetical protein N0V94_001909 [Neodidymelliopsis sp. IMI 364377]|nr:hypothetical protein N0V94_001909 [Neodidymelliopsis sp. IMI 364377]